MRHERHLRSSPFFATAVAVCTAAILSLAGCEEEDTTPPKPSSWPVFHGTPDMVGVADTTLPARPGVKWKRKLGKSVKSSPVIDGGRVFVGTDNGDLVDGELVALDLADGRVLWRFSGKKKFEGIPLVFAGTVYAGSADHFFYALDAATGELRWKYEADKEFMGGANVYRSADGKDTWILAGNYDYKLYCFDAADGRVVWTCETNYYVNGTPAVVGDEVIFGGCDGKVRVLAAKDGKEIRQFDAGAYVAGGVAITGGRVYLSQFGGNVMCFDLASGDEVWEFTDAQKEYYSTPAVGPGQLIVGCRDYCIYGLDRDTGKFLWKVPTLGDVDSSPAIAGDKAVIGSRDGRLYMVSPARGKVLWSYDCGRPITSSPAVASGLIVVGCEDGTVFAFGRR
jgi:eukaryotic-like serine/threonine-protein kinase